jgi:hypothetical protein
VETILDEVSNQPGVLPLLQHSLLELWKRQRGGFLTLEDYRKSGGVKEAITRTADKIFEEFSPHQKEITQRILLRLTQPGEGTEDTRRRASMNELVTRPEESEEVEKVIGQLVDHRLLTTSKELDTDERWVDVSHEALIRGWKLLREWIEKDRAGLRIHRRLNEAAQEWVRMKRDDGLLYRGARLVEALEWRENNEAALNERERDFLNSSEALRIREKEAERERELRELEAAQRLAATEKKRAEAAQALARSERKARVRQRYLTVVVSALLVAALGAAWIAFQQQKISHSRELASAAINQMNRDPELSASLAVAAVGMAYTIEAENTLRDALIALHHSHLRALLAGHKGSVRGASFSPDGERIATAGEDHRVLVWEMESGKVLFELEEEKRHRAIVYSAVFDPHGDRIVTASKDGTARVWDARKGKMLLELSGKKGHKGPVRSAAFNHDGTRIVTAGEDKTVRVWDAKSGEMLFELEEEKRHGGIVSCGLADENGS